VSSRVRVLLVLLIVVPLGIGTKFYAGPGAVWVNGSLGGMLYEVFWCLTLALVARRPRPGAIAVSVFLATCVIEFSQLWHPTFLESLRAGFLGRTILGDTFDWNDFPPYLVGSILGWVLMRRTLAPDGKKTFAAG
jgi:hypothetical protein